MTTHAAAQLAAINAIATALERPPRLTTSIEVYRDNEGDVLFEHDVYHGRRGPDGCHVRVSCSDDPHFSYPLPVRRDLVNHSPTGFEWGFPGSGPAQLALALLARATDDHRLALDLYQAFKAEVVTSIVEEEWTLPQGFILRWVVSKTGCVS